MENGSEREQQVTPTSTAKPKRKTAGTVTHDPETVAITRISNLLNALDDVPRARVLGYIIEKFDAEASE